MNVDEETLKWKLEQFLQAQINQAATCWKEYGPGTLSQEHITEAVEKFLKELKAEELVAPPNLNMKQLKELTER